MSLKKLGVALLAVFVLGAIAANGAFAAFEESGGTWIVGGSKLAEGTHEAITTESVGKLSLETEVGGSPLDITWAKTTCVSCFIDNTAGTVATTMGVWSTTEVTVSQPAGGVCKVKGGEIKTKEMTTIVGMKSGSPTIDTVKFSPMEGTTFATVTIEGAECPAAFVGTFKLTGSQFAEGVSATGTFATSQNIKMNKEINASAGGELKFGEKPAIVTGEFKSTLTSGKSFGTEK